MVWIFLVRVYGNQVFSILVNCASNLNIDDTWFIALKIKNYIYTRNRIWTIIFKRDTHTAHLCSPALQLFAVHSASMFSLFGFFFDLNNNRQKGEIYITTEQTQRATKKCLSEQFSTVCVYDLTQHISPGGDSSLSFHAMIKNVFSACY